MTLATDVMRNDYVGTGAVSIYPYTFTVYNAEDLKVLQTDDGGNVTELVLNTDYTVTGVGVFAGGDIVLAGNLPADYLLTIRSNLPYVQETDLRNQGGYYPDVTEQQFDKTVRLIQQLRDTLNRALTVPESELMIGNLPGVTQRADKLLSFDSNGDPVAAALADQSASALAIALAAYDTNAHGAGMIGFDAGLTYPANTVGAAIAGTGAVSFLLAATGAVSRTFNSKMSDWISSADFGLVGDGSDESAKLQAFLNAIQNKAGLLLPGTYSSGSTLQIKTGTYLLGFPNAVIKGHSSLSSSAPLFANASPGTDVDIFIEGVTFDGNKSVLTTRSVELLSMARVTGLRFERCVVKNCEYIGLAIGGGVRAAVVGCLFTTTGKTAVTAEGGAAIWLGPSGGSNQYDVIIDGNEFRDLEWSAIYANGYNVRIVNNKMTTVKEGGIFSSVTYAQNLIIDGNMIDTVVRKNISSSGIEVGCPYVVITNNTIRNVQADGISVTDVQSAAISGNIISDVKQDPSYYLLGSAITIITTETAGSEPRYTTITGNQFVDFKNGVNGGGYRTEPYAFVSVGNSGDAVDYILIEGNNAYVAGYYASGGGAGAYVVWQSGKRGTGCLVKNNNGPFVNNDVPAGSLRVGGWNTTLTGSTYTRIKFDTTVANEGGAGAGGITEGFKPTIEGWYLVSASVLINGLQPDKGCLLTIYKNGARHKDIGYYNCPANSTSNMTAQLSGSALVYLNGSSDYVQIYGWSNSTADCLANGTAVESTNFSICKVNQ